MNIRLQKYKKNRLAGMNQYNAARAAGYSESYAKTASDRVERSIKVDIRDAFEQAGLTDKKIIEHALFGLNATREIIIEGAKFGDQPEWGVRHKYLETILKMTDRLRDKVEHSGSIKTGETKIYIITDKKEVNAGDTNKAQRIPREICI